MNKLFYIDIVDGIEISYDDLLEDLSIVDSFSVNCYASSYYTIFKNIIISLLYGKEIVLLDSDFSREEIASLLGSDFNLNVEKLKPIGKLTISELNKRIDEAKSNWSLTLFTSGTTGLPKKITHNYSSLCRFVKQESSREDNIWGFAYNPTHMAGLQVFFQAFLNQNTLVRLFGLSRENIFNLIDKYQITNISATPTFYRLLLPAYQSYPCVTNLTSGGEKFDSSTLTSLIKIFPKAKVRNVYASTEAGSLFSAKGDVFEIPISILSLVKIVDSELYIHKSLLGDTSLLTLDNEWYGTNDLVEVLSENPITFKFISRKNEMINTGGYKVNPSEVEEIIRSCDGIKDVYVYGKKNSLLGSVVCAEIVKCEEQLTEKEIRDFMKNKLQEFKVPRVMKFVDALSMTRTGKLSRK